VGGLPRAVAHLPPGFPRLADVPGHRRSGSAGPGLLRGLLCARRARSRPLRRLPDCLRGRDARPGHQRRHAPYVCVLGDHHRLVVPAHRPRQPQPGEPGGRHPGARGDHPRRPGHARRNRPHRPAHRHLPARRAGESPGRPRERGRRGPRRAALGGCGSAARRGVVQVGPGALPLLATGRHGRPDAGQRLSARCRHGQGRDLSRGAAGPGVRGAARLAADLPHPRRRHDAARCLPRAAAARPQAAPRLRHGEPARLPGRARRHRFGAGRPSRG
jgi:hypothetical protein